MLGVAQGRYTPLGSAAGRDGARPFLVWRSPASSVSDSVIGGPGYLLWWHRFSVPADYGDGYAGWLPVCLFDHCGQVGWSIGCRRYVFVHWGVVLDVFQLPALQGGDVQVFVDGLLLRVGRVASAVLEADVVADQAIELAGWWCDHVADGTQVGVGMAEHGAI